MPFEVVGSAGARLGPVRGEEPHHVRGLRRPRHGHGERAGEGVDVERRRRTDQANPRLVRSCAELVQVTGRAVHADRRLTTEMGHAATAEAHRPRSPGRGERAEGREVTAGKQIRVGPEERPQHALGDELVAHRPVEEILLVHGRPVRRLARVQGMARGPNARARGDGEQHGDRDEDTWRNGHAINLRGRAPRRMRFVTSGRFLASVRTIPAAASYSW